MSHSFYDILGPTLCAVPARRGQKSYGLFRGEAALEVVRQVAVARGAAAPRAFGGAVKRLRPQLGQTGAGQSPSSLACDDLVSADKVPVGALICAAGRRSEAPAARGLHSSPF